MAKGKSQKGSRATGGGSGWSSSDFERRSYLQSKKLELKRRRVEATKEHSNEEEIENQSKIKSRTRKVSKEERAQLLSHGTQEKLDEKRLKLQISRTKREVESLRSRLKAWDDVEERQKEKERERVAAEERKRMADIENGVKKKRKRAGPETWKLKGAARPAHEVYDFDVRYVDPHLKAHEDAKEKRKRIVNVICVHKGNFGSISAPQPYCREFLSLLMQLGMLYIEAKKYKLAREVLKECMDLEGDENVVTSSRKHLMRMYLEMNRPDSARRLWERLPQDQSCWIRYSAALLEFVSYNILHEEGSSKETAEKALSKAITANFFCVFYLAFHSNFENVMEYAEEIDDAEEGTVEEAIEYCHSQLEYWKGTDNALDWVKDVVLRIWNGENIGGCSKCDLENWDSALTKIEYEYEKKSECNDSEEDEEPDSLMYAGMYRTAMDMIVDSGHLT